MTQPDNTLAIEVTSQGSRSSTALQEQVERLRSRQRSLIDQYKHEPETAMIRDSARTHDSNLPGDGPLDPLHGWVELGVGHQVNVPVSVHYAVGGLSDLPVSGDILCGALASCMDTSIRVVTAALRVELQSLSVEVTGDVDVRGTLYVSPDVPVGFQRFNTKVVLRAMPGTNPGRLERALAAAEHSCVVMQTLRTGVPVTTEYDAEVLPANN